MQGHHLHAFGAIFLFLLALEHVAQDEFADGVLDGHLAFFVFFQGVLQRLDQEPDVTHAVIGGLVAGAVGAQPVLVVDVHDHAAQGRDRVFAGTLLAHPVHEALEARQAIGEAAVEVFAQADFVGGGVHRDLALGGVVAQLLQRGRADLAARHVDHPQEGVVVVRVHDQAEVGHQVLYFLATEKAVAAGQAIRHLVVLQFQLDQLGLVVAAIQDREIAVRAVGAQVQAEDFHGHALGLGVLVAAPDHADLVAVAHFTPQLLFEFVGVVRDQHVGAAQDAAGGAIVLLQHHHFQGRVVVLEQHQVFRARAAPGVDRLVVVAHHGELVAFADEHFHQQILAGVGVLVFVHQQVAHLVLPLFQDVGVFFEQLHRQQDQVVEIHRVERLERALVVGVDDGSGLFLGVARVFQGLGRQDQVVFPGADHVLDLVDAVVARVFLLHDVGHQGLDVGLVEDREARFVAQPHVFLADDVQAQVVEGADRQATTFAGAQQGADPFLHLAGGLVGKGHGDDVLGADAAVLDQVRDFARDHAGLAGASTGEHQKRAADVAHGFLLPGIESGHR
ncbi:hypothetical protein PS647_04769 [Pseudomonas fluorescens]|nr:hypothetical protein PS647_04769 [Pseudomonas fluorescens]